MTGSIHRIDKTQITPSVDGKSLVTEASDIGLHPGEWPEWIRIMGAVNDGFLYRRGREMTRYEEFIGYEYERGDGHLLIVFND